MQLVLLAIYALTQACAAPVQFDCGAEWAQCGSSGHPSCCQGPCTCAGSGAYKQCTPAKGQWKCGSKPTPPPAPTPPTPPPTQPAKLIGYWSTTWAAVPAPKDANMGVAFSGENNPAQALSESEPHRSSLVGSKWIDAGGGNKNGRWNAQVLSQWESSIVSGALKAWAGIVFDVEECYSEGLAKNFASVLRAAKAAGMETLVTVSHSAPYGCTDAFTLMQSFFSSADVDYLSPQLYTSGSEAVPDFTPNHAANWSAWTGAKGRFVPSVGCNALKKGGYANVTQYFRKLNITTTGYLVWPSSGCKL